MKEGSSRDHETDAPKVNKRHGVVYADPANLHSLLYYVNVARFDRLVAASAGYATEYASIKTPHTYMQRDHIKLVAGSLLWCLMKKRYLK